MSNKQQVIALSNAMKITDAYNNQLASMAQW